MEFNREKERGRDVDAFHFDASRLAAAGSYFIGPETKPICVWLAIEKIEIVLPDEKLRVIDWIGARTGAGIVQFGGIRSRKDSAACRD